MSERASSPVLVSLAGFALFCGAWLLVCGGGPTGAAGEVPQTPEMRARAEIAAAMEAMEKADRANAAQNFGAASELNAEARDRLIAAMAHLADADQ